MAGTNITFIGHDSEKQTINKLQVTFIQPTGFAIGDIFVVCLSIGNSNAITPPSGWTTVVTFTDPNSKTFGVFWFPVTSTSLATYQFSWSNSTICAGILTCWRGCNISNPVEQFTNQSMTALTTVVNGAPLTTTKINEMIVWLETGGGTATLTLPSSLSSGGNVDTSTSPDCRCSVGYKILPSKQLTPSSYTNGTLSAPHSTAVVILALQYAPPYDLLSSL